MEQLVARRAHNPKVVGSSPAPATEAVDENQGLSFFPAVGSSSSSYPLASGRRFEFCSRYLLSQKPKSKGFFYDRKI
jgi:hypothetical protein